MLKRPLPRNRLEVGQCENSLILPGFIDCHVHYPQTEIIGAYGAQLIDWLNKYTFIAEQNVKNKEINFLLKIHRITAINCSL